MTPAAVLVLVLVSIPACHDGDAASTRPQPPAQAPAPESGESTPSPFASELARCVEITNEYRTTAGKPALSASSALERYAALAAAHDGRAHEPHRYFDRTDGGGIALAENLVPWWSLRRRPSVRAIVEEGLAFMWKEGPRGAHRRNMIGPYTEIGCGIFVNGDEVTVVQAFR